MQMRRLRSLVATISRLAPAGVALVVLATGQPARSSAAMPTPATIAACDASSASGQMDADPTLVQINFTNACGQSVPFAVEMAVTSQQQQSGLMAVGNLPADEGELFVFDNIAGGREILVPFWMEDTPLPLSIAFVGKDETVHELQDMQAESTTLHVPRRPYLYAVEANLGWFAQHQIGPGSSVDLSAALSLVGLAP